MASVMATAYDRTAELRVLDATFSGGVASDMTHLPRILHVHDDDDEPPPPQTPSIEKPPSTTVPVIDLSGADRATVVAAVRSTAVEWGSFQVTGLVVPKAATDAMPGFHEAGGGEGSDKARLYSREPARAVKYHCNLDPPHGARRRRPAGRLPNFGTTLFELLSEARRLKSSYLTDIECNQGQIILYHYYPPCTQPELAIRTTRHSDSAFLAILPQGKIGGLQILHEDWWVDVTPTPRPFIVNIGDLLQLISNNRFRSVEHRVVAKNAAPRVSIACFFSRHFHLASMRTYGPMKELLSDENPPLYRESLVRDYIKHYYSIGLDAKTAISISSCEL